MTTEHKLAWALRAVADDENARFSCDEYYGDTLLNNKDILEVLTFPDYDWKLVKKPVVTHEFYVFNEETGNYLNLKTFVHVKQWNMHITLIDGVPQKEVEFR